MGQTDGSVSDADDAFGPSGTERGPGHPRARGAGRHRRRSAADAGASAELDATNPVHPDGRPGGTPLTLELLADDPVSTEASAPRRRRNPTLVFLRDVVVVIVLAVVISMLVKTFLIRPYYIPSASMSDTLVVNDRVLVNLLVPDLVAVNRGDVVVFIDPGGWLAPTSTPPKTPGQAIVDGALEAVGLKPEDSNNSLIKRVIGVPGDHVVCCNSYGQLVINDQAVSEPYVELGGNQAASGVAFDVTVPAESLWVMGDNRYNSEDSRFHQDLPTHGFVPMDNVVGRAIVLNWPLDRITILGNYPEVFAGVPSRDPNGSE
ncbi:signal peptidase I [Pseudoclavibacter chungangensis]|uniref:Signal peptidase I n=1 Tax=Pseudoclavibacter chungangensis TaxID=587635 RepID=A0A7J5BYZ4_9MICO|nr:signal peptidase I [Pseudoclavibacter chungangensis]NYJ67400.1 signal peptidase I [Pseudoclavibacter chungangensis]